MQLVAGFGGHPSPDSSGFPGSRGFLNDDSYKVKAIFRDFIFCLLVQEVVTIYVVNIKDHFRLCF